MNIYCVLCFLRLSIILIQLQLTLSALFHSVTNRFRTRSMSILNHHQSMMLSVLFLVVAIGSIVSISADDYTIDPDNKSLLIAAGCFWCAEQAFEQYAPGVIEAVSGYAGANGIDNPTYRNHPGHYEVILIEYDPTKTSYKLLVEYAYRNIDLFDGGGQFCDRGFSYYPAIFYDGEDERLMAEEVTLEVLEEYPEWDEASLAVPLLERPTFWTAEDYHQDFYITNSRNYGYYKERCGRTQRLKDVWGEEEYYCYHDVDTSCLKNGTVVNEEGIEVVAVVNVKDVPEEGEPALLPKYGIILVSLAAVLVGAMLLACVYKRMKNRNSSNE